jgi:hypothetical protein
MITLSHLSEWRRNEKETAILLVPIPLADLEAYVKKVKEEAGDLFLQGTDCEAHAALDLIQDTMQIRRAKLARAAELNPHADPPSPKTLYDFESCCWFALTEGYRYLDEAIEEVNLTGNWCGKWGPRKK